MSTPTERRFQPTAADFGDAWEGVPVHEFEEGGIVVLTDDPDLATRALAAYCKDSLLDPEYLAPIETRWAVFEWQSATAEREWRMTLAAEGDDQALHIHYVP